MMCDFGVSEVLIFGLIVRLVLIVFFVSRLVVSSMFGFDVFVYDVIVVISMLLFFMLMLLFVVYCVFRFFVFFVKLFFVIGFENRLVNVDLMWLILMWFCGCFGFVSDGVIVVRLSVIVFV